MQLWFFFFNSLFDFRGYRWFERNCSSLNFFMCTCTEIKDTGEDSYPSDLMDAYVLRSDCFFLVFFVVFFCLFRVLQIQYTLEPNLRIVKNTVTFEWSIKLMYGYYPLSFPGRPTLGKVTNMLFILVYSFYVAVHDSYFANKGFTFKQGMNSLIVCLLHTFFNHGFFFFFLLIILLGLINYC